MPKVYSGDLTKMFDISGKKAVIIGGAGGFGKAIAEGYAANGCSVLISSRREEALKAAKAEIEAVAAPGGKGRGRRIRAGLLPGGPAGKQQGDGRHRQDQHHAQEDPADEQKRRVLPPTPGRGAAPAAVSVPG